MPLLTSWARRSPVVALPVAALLIAAAGTGSAFAASPAHRLAAGARVADSPRSAAAKISWHPLHLINGWKSGSTVSLDTGAPSYAVSGGMVYLTGSLHQPHGADAIFARLPKSIRPAHKLWIEIWTNAAAAGVLFIEPDGMMQAYNGGAQTLASLATVSFPTAAIKPHALKLLNHWVSDQPVFNSGAPSYAISGGVVHLFGALHRTSGSSDLPAVLPRPARPKHDMYLTVYSDAGAVGSLHITPGGSVLVFGSATSAFTSFAGISYPVATTKWHKLSLADGWVSSQSIYNSGDPSYAVIRGVVYLSGSMHEASGDSGLFGSLPTAARPAHVLELATYTFNGAFGALSLIPTGFMFVVSHPQSTAMSYTSLAAISYPRNS
jgi:hypothetical protein